MTGTDDAKARGRLCFFCGKPGADKHDTHDRDFHSGECPKNPDEVSSDDLEHRLALAI